MDGTSCNFLPLSSSSSSSTVFICSSDENEEGNNREEEKEGTENAGLISWSLVSNIWYNRGEKGIEKGMEWMFQEWRMEGKTITGTGLFLPFPSPSSYIFFYCYSWNGEDERIFISLLLFSLIWTENNVHVQHEFHSDHPFCIFLLMYIYMYVSMIRHEL